MIGPKSVGLLIAILSLLTAIASTPADAGDIPKAEIDRLLAAGGYAPAWHIDQGNYNDNGPRWEINVYSAPRQIQSDICVSTVLIADVVRSGEHYAFVDTGKPHNQVALWNCNAMFRRHRYFTELNGDITDEELIRAVHAVRLFVRSGGNTPEISGRFATGGLRPALRQVDDNSPHWIDKQEDGTISFRYVARSILPDILVFRVTLHSDDTSEIYVDRENGPDIVPAR